MAALDLVDVGTRQISFLEVHYGGRGSMPLVRNSNSGRRGGMTYDSDRSQRSVNL